MVDRTGASRFEREAARHVSPDSYRSSIEAYCRRILDGWGVGKAVELYEAGDEHFAEAERRVEYDIGLIEAQADSPIEVKLGEAMIDGGLSGAKLVLETSYRDLPETTGVVTAVLDLITKPFAGSFYSPIFWAICPQVLIDEYRVDFLLFAGRWQDGQFLLSLIHI